MARRSAGPRLWFPVLLLFLGGVLTGLFLLWPRPGRASTSEGVELPFSHRVHVQEVQMECLFCHSQALRDPQAGLPSLQRCMICHDAFSLEDPEAQAKVEQVKEAYVKGLRVRWPDVYRQPDFVYFSHRPHVTGGVACETCHGPVASMDLVQEVVRMNMGFCVDCHKRQDPEEVPRLLECVTCHK